MSKLNEKYLPVHIMNFEFRIVVFHMMLGLPLTVSDETKRSSKGINRKYKGSLPASLDCFKLWRLCEEEGGKDGFGVPYVPTGSRDSIKCSDALINVYFSDNLFSVIIHCGELSRDKRFPGRRSFNISENEYVQLRERYNEFKKNYKKQQEFYSNGDNRGTQAAKDGYSHVRDCFLKLLGYYVKLRMKQIYKDDYKEKQGKLGVRSLIYQEGITVETQSGPVRYAVYKRSASKAKSGDCLFIAEEFRDKMLEWTWLGLPYQDISGIDLTSAKAYEALLSSSIENTVEIDPKHILLIESVETDDAPGNRRVLYEEKIPVKGEKDKFDLRYVLLTPEEYKDKTGNTFKCPNNIWDGQALVDESVFERAGYKKTPKKDDRHGMMLLRNSFFKACAFNTKIREYYKNRKVKELVDMFGNRFAPEDIEMIVTPDSIKLFKFAKDFFPEESKTDPQSAMKMAYDHWREHIPHTFGIVKTEKASHLGRGKYHEAGYQVLNTLPLNKSDMEKVLEDDLRFIDLLKNNEALMMYRLKNTSKSVRKRYFMYIMYKHFEDFENNRIFNDFRNEEINDYKKKLRRGRVKLAGDFYVLCSMPFEMLKYSHERDRSKINPRLSAGQAYIRGYNTGKTLLFFRYPHMSSSSICIQASRNVKEYDEWFNFENKDGSNIIVISPWDSNIMVKLGGADFDSDSVLVIENETVQKAAGKLLKINELSGGKWELPVSQPAPELKNAMDFPYRYFVDDMAQIDHNLSDTGRTIGSISNDVQLFNSYLWEEYYKEDGDPERIKTIYDCILKLSVLNELEIDRSKHEIALDTSYVRTLIRDTVYAGKFIIARDGKKAFYPAFLKERVGKGTGILREDGNDEYAKFWDCPVDHIGRILAERDGGKDRNKTSEDSFLNNALQPVDTDRPEQTAEREIRNKIKSRILEACLDLERIDKERQDGTSREGERDEVQSNCIQDCLNEFGNRGAKIRARIMVRLFHMPIEKYSNDSKRGARKAHKAGEYKYPDVAVGKVKFRFLGFLAALASALAEESEEILKQCFRLTRYRRNTLLYEITPGLMPIQSDDILQIWGINYKVGPDKSKDDFDLDDSEEYEDVYTDEYEP